MNDHPPDWGRAMVIPPSAQMPLGDPTRWGALVNQNIAAGNGVDPRGEVNYSGQIAYAQCKDQYARAWSIIGTLSAPHLTWSMPDGEAVDEWAAVMSVTMGVGQAAVIHNINLRAVCEADRPFYWNSNPDLQMFGTEGYEVRPFVIPGAIIGNSVAIQIIQSYFLSTAFGAFTFTTNVAITPFAAGKGL